MPADGISPPPSAFAVPIGRPRRRKAPRGSAPRSLRKSRLPFRRRRKHPRQAKKSRRLRPSQRKNSQKQRRLESSLSDKWPWVAALRPLGQVLGIGADGAAMTRTALPAGLTIPPVNANLARSGPRGATRPRRLPKKKLRRRLSVLREHRSMNLRKSPHRACVGATAIPAWLRGFRSSK